ncbi:M15 family metallopeptidase [Phycicoccus avicenniae]|uniref:M15 family metallopeptidase n=1 Tax=Phycicoccus avicenniae TaxID=2828860 RepID=UPI003D2E510D
MSALRRPLTLLLAPLLTLAVLIAAAPTAGAATSSLAWGGYSNGKIPSSALCAIPWDTSDRMRCDATVKLIALNTLYKAKWGSNLCINDAYRSYDKQVALFKKYGSPRAAKPGTSTHGWGLALDLGCGINVYTDARHKWLSSVGPKYGYAQPSWALAKGSNPEPWHWQYFGTYNPGSRPPAPKPPTPTPAPPPAPKVATTATVAVTGLWPRTATVTLKSKTTGKALASAPVLIATRAVDATAFSYVRTVKTNAAGQVAFVDSPDRPTVARFTYAGTTTTLPTSATATLTTVTELSGSYVRDRRGPVVSGRLTTPDDVAVSNQTVALQRRLADSTTWTTVASLQSDARGAVWSEVQREKDSYYRFSYAGKSGQYVGDVSREVRVRMKTPVTGRG